MLCFREVRMRLTTVAALAAAAAVILAAWPADAQTRKRARTSVERYTVTRTVATRPAARITVRKARSFLDPGTEVLPMSRNYTDYAFPPNYSPTSVVSGPTTPAGHQNPWWPLPGRFDLPGQGAWYSD
jgi:ABC-type molybdate transport system substrate-binding protein